MSDSQLLCVANDSTNIEKIIKEENIEAIVGVKSLQKFLDDDHYLVSIGGRDLARINNLSVVYLRTPESHFNIRDFFKKKRETIVDDVVVSKVEKQEINIDDVDEKCREILQEFASEASDNHVAGYMRVIDYMARLESSNAENARPSLLRANSRVLTHMMTGSMGSALFFYLPCEIEEGGGEEMAEMSLVHDIDGSMYVEELNQIEDAELKEIYADTFFSMGVRMNIDFEKTELESDKGVQYEVSTEISRTGRHLLFYNDAVAWAVENMVPGVIMVIHLNSIETEEDGKEEFYSPVYTWIIHENSIDGTSATVSKNLFNNIRKTRYDMSESGAFDNPRFCNSPSIPVSPFNSVYGDIPVAIEQGICATFDQLVEGNGDYPEDEE